MKRNWIVWFLLVISIMTLLFAAGGEEAVIPQEEETVAVFYVASTDDTVTRYSAIYTAQMLSGSWPDKPFFISRIPTQNTKGFSNVQDAIRGSAFTNGKLDERKEDLGVNKFKSIQGKTCDIWFIIPENAAEFVLGNEKLAEQLKQAVSENQSKVHLVFLAENGIESMTQNALLLSAVPNIEWIQIQKDYLATECKTGGKDTVHTGDYLAASVYGAPLDLPLTEENGQWKFELQENSHVFVMVRGKAIQEDGAIDIRDEANNPVSVNRGAINNSIIDQDAFSYLTAKSDKVLNKGSYTITGEWGDDFLIKAYWYPDFDNTIQPTLDTDETWKLGSNDILLKLQNILNDADQYSVQITFSDGNTAPLSLGYLEEEQCWRQNYTVVEDSSEESFVPSVVLRMKDGNKAWEWTGDIVTKQIKTGEVNVKEDAPKEATIYYWENTVPQFAEEWERFFEFNPVENPERKASVPEEMKGWKAIEKSTGFEIQYDPQTTESETELADFEITLSCGGVEHPVTLHLVNGKQLFDAACQITMFDDTSIKAGGSIVISAVVKNISEWEKAKEQLDEEDVLLPDLNHLELLVTFTDQSGKQIPVKTEMLKPGDNGERSASITVEFDDRSEAKNYTVSAALKDQGNEWKNTQRALAVENSKPKIKEGVQYTTKLIIDGFPGNYQSINLLESVFGDQKISELFTDEETKIQSVDIKLTQKKQNKENDPDGITIDGESAQDTSYKIEGNALPQIQVLLPGQYIVELTAWDGVNRSDPLSIEITVKSRFFQIVLYVGIGVAAAVLVLIILLIIREKRKPAFNETQIRCVLSEKPSAENNSEMLQKSQIIPMERYQKRGITLDKLVILARQPETSPAITETLKDITLYPTKYEDIRLVFGKNAMNRIGRQSSQEQIGPGSIFRFRIENTYFQIENYR